MTVLFSNGYVGIGATGPTEILDINGNVRIRNVPSASSANNVLSIN